MIDDPGNTHPIDTLWALISLDRRGNEGICGMKTDEGHMPCIFSERHLVEQAEEFMRPHIVGRAMELQIVEFHRVRKNTH